MVRNGQYGDFKKSATDSIMAPAGSVSACGVNRMDVKRNASVCERSTNGEKINCGEVEVVKYMTL